MTVITGGRYYRAFVDDVPDREVSDAMRKYAIAQAPKPSPLAAEKRHSKARKRAER